MKQVLITGATGNVGQEVIRHLRGAAGVAINAGVRIINENIYVDDPHITLRTFDFGNRSTFRKSLQDIDVLFLLRPPKLADINEYFLPLIEAAKEATVKHIIFLSVQGAERIKYIPHYKIEQLIIKSGIDYTFLRPGYFMQNLTTTLLPDIKHKNRIFLPAGKAKFNWIDVTDIGEAAAKIIANPQGHLNKGYTLTGCENLNFYEVADMITEVLGSPINYERPNLVKFFSTKFNEGLPFGLILVMVGLHWFPRFQKEPQLSPYLEMLINHSPKKLHKFLEENKHIF